MILFAILWFYFMLTSILKITQLGVLSVGIILHKVVGTINFLLLFRNVGVNVERILKFILFLYNQTGYIMTLASLIIFHIRSSCFYTEYLQSGTFETMFWLYAN